MCKLALTVHVDDIYLKLFFLWFFLPREHGTNNRLNNPANQSHDIHYATTIITRIKIAANTKNITAVVAVTTTTAVPPILSP